ncbi:MAG: hypothetical protein A2W19_00280 [Spirochaetes bacterium RBG_16_49_21]|nr:MAG: hypothetical protein A2W19_00280 [Spirochaetes bacterium RBG_16_49_21]
MKKEKWILERKKEVLPFTYFHVVFTLPDALNRIVLKNKRSMFTLMFQACGETLLSVSADEKYFGADNGRLFIYASFLASCGALSLRPDTLLWHPFPQK